VEHGLSIEVALREDLCRDARVDRSNKRRASVWIDEGNNDVESVFVVEDRSDEVSVVSHEVRLRAVSVVVDCGLCEVARAEDCCHVLDGGGRRGVVEVGVVDENAVDVDFDVVGQLVFAELVGPENVGVGCFQGLLEVFLNRLPTFWVVVL